MTKRAGGTEGAAARTKPGFQWTDAKREAFLGLLAQTCNVKASCQALGMPTGALYKLRQRDEAFAGQWRAALLAGYDRLEEQLLQAAGAALTGEGDDMAGGKAAPRFDPELAMRLLDRHRRSIAGDRRNRGGPVTRATRAEAEAALHAKLDMIERKRKPKTGR